ncbi:uncharacterized protein LOC123513589 [Portunus trituberculatus]|uniref:uncharacterized protein LOC123513589 n=1 Tax=Portunus trituberculatus TaxID=210409 RepID=UPI001E1CF3DA|nr:uncharacterized protein LOC123513589 [Portunus trituberculatus]
MAGVVPDEQYEVQFLGFSPSLFVEGVEQVIVHRLDEALNQLEEQFSKLDPEVLPEDERQRGMTKLRAETDRTLAVLQQAEGVYLNSFIGVTTLLDALRVPAHLLHPADLEQANPATAEEVEALNQELEALRQELLNERYMKKRCQAQLKNIEKALEEQRKVLDGPLNPAAMTKVEEAKERLCLIRDNQEDLVTATLQAREATKDLPKDSSSPDMYLAQESFK